ncbi:alcohol dehydrogenase catalytic domain-containing protein [Bacillus xiapuensis]|uniref:alcohol dehydrogenase catalytic domain-containing protein n=1 Tax=Bacillus xiapuensis TaxID=2014075 RepID=UPI000C23D9B3|nr:alcohol dehydrogenase catalytic domain-containing protein [Bacillus xiapuensis]
MLAGVIEKKGHLALQDREIPVLTAEDQVKLKVEAASICGTDVHILADPPGHPSALGIIQGHEFTGEVVETGSAVQHVRAGDRVVVDPTTTCGFCYYCQIGEQNLCEDSSTIGIFMNGGWAPYSVIPAKNVHKISKTVSPDVAVFAEPLSCVINGVSKLDMQLGNSVVILGAGPMGQLFTQVMKASGVGVIICVDLSDYRLGYSQVSGATHVLNPKKENVASFVKRLTGAGADIVIDCAGALFDQSLNLVRKGGQVLLVGMNEHANPSIKQYDITRNEIAVKGTFIQKCDFPRVVRTLEANLLDLKGLITHRLPLSKVHEGVEAMRKGEALKVILYPE